jgi:hypothetical protein
VNSKQRPLFLNPMYCGPGDSKVAIFPIASIRWELGVEVQKWEFKY